MKSLPFLTAALALTAGMGACTSPSAPESTQLAGDTISVDSTDTVNGWVCAARAKAFYPKATATPLAQNIREWMDEQTGGLYTGNPDSGQVMITAFASRWIDSCRSQTAGLPPMDPPSASMRMECQLTLMPICESDSFITFLASGYQFTGGAHGSAFETGQTFRKTDGRRFGWEMFRSDAEPQLRELIKKGLMTYFEVTTDEALAGMLLEPATPDYLPLPKAQPYLTADGIKLTYAQYEIAPYAAGMPTITLPYEQVRPLLTQAAQRLMAATPAKR